MQTLKLTKKYEKYPEYKDSGVEWLGNIPKDWEKNKLKRLFSFQSGDGFPDNLQGGQTGDVPFLKVSDINGVDQYVSNANNYVDLKMVKEKSWHLIPSGSILMPKIGAALSKNHRKVNTVPVCIDNNMLAVVPQNIVKEFGYWIWKMLNMSDFENISSVPSVNLNQLRNYSLAIPDTSEQKKIAKYLDEKTSAVDQIIERKQKLVDFLIEKRTAVINNAVTKGLNKKVELVESGVEWVGKIPKGWKLLPLKYNVEIQEGPGIMAEDFKEVGVPLLRIRNLKNGFVDLEGSNFLDPKKVESKWSHFRLKQGDLLISGSASSGIVAEVVGAAVGSVAYTGLIRITSKSLYKDFLKSLLDSKYFNEQVEVQKAGTAMQHYGPTHLKKVVVAIPLEDEQKSIAHKVQKIREIYLTSISNIEKSIELLQEFKSSLISNVITGKIKV